MLQAALVVPDARTGQVRATCRIVTPELAAAWGGFSSERHFDFSALSPLRPRLLEIDALALEPAWPAAQAFASLGDRVARFLIANRLDFVFATAAVGIADGGHTAASMHHHALADARAPDDLHVSPLRPLEVERLCITLPASPEPNLKGWLGLGAWVCGAPAWNHDRHCAEIPLLLALSRLRSPRARQFLADAA